MTTDKKTAHKAPMRRTTPKRTPGEDVINLDPGEPPLPVHRTVSGGAQLQPGVYYAEVTTVRVDAEGRLHMNLNVTDEGEDR